MYKLVFLLIFSAVTGAKDITLEIDFKSKTETSCQVTPAGTQTWTEDDHIRFLIHTPTTLKDFWCQNAEGKTIYNSYNSESTKTTQNNGSVYTCAETSFNSKTDMNSTWTCTYEILKEGSIGKSFQSICLFQVKVTDKPVVSLYITQLSTWIWKNRTKLYNYPFTEGNKTFDYILDNPTENEETYNVYIKQDGSEDKLFKNVTIKPHHKTHITDVFKLNKNSKHITCSATNKKGYGPDLRTEINLQYIPPPRVHLFTSGPRELKIGEFSQENNTQTYHYDFTDGEELTINCTLENTFGYEGHYVLNLCIKNNEYATPPDTCVMSKEAGKSQFVDKLILSDEAKLSPTIDTNPRIAIPAEADIVLFSKNARKSNNVFNNLKTARSESSTSRTFKLKKGDNRIFCTVHNKKTATDLSLPDDLYNVIYLRHTPGEDQVETGFTFYVNGPSELEDKVSYVKNFTQIYEYSYEFTDDEEISVILEVNERNEDTYDIKFYLDRKKYDGRGGKGENDSLSRPNVRSKRYLMTPQDFSLGKPLLWSDFAHGKSSKKVTFELNQGNKLITCEVRNKGNRTLVQKRIVKLKRKEQKSASGVELKMEGLPEKSCRSVDSYDVTQICNYTFNDSSLLGKTKHLNCVLTNGENDSQWKVIFETNRNTVQFQNNDSSQKIVSYGITLNSKNNTVKCTATKVTKKSSNTLTIDVNVYYIPPPTTTTTFTTPEPTTTSKIESPIPPQVNSSNQGSQSSGEDGLSIMGWLKWVLVGGAVLITICVVVGCLVMHRQKKPPPANSTYANLTKDQNNSTPVPAPRTIQKTNGAQKPNAAHKPNVTLENNYSEPKDSQDMSEALYADPNRFVGDSSNYAEPYAAKPSPRSDTYAEPYKSNYAEPYPCSSEGHYAELNQPDSSGKELYAKPIPKAQRNPKVKDDSNYSNVFGGQYGNTKK